MYSSTLIIAREPRSLHPVNTRNDWLLSNVWSQKGNHWRMCSTNDTTNTRRLYTQKWVENVKWNFFVHGIVFEKIDFEVARGTRVFLPKLYRVRVQCLQIPSQKCYFRAINFARFAYKYNKKKKKRPENSIKPRVIRARGTNKSILAKTEPLTSKLYYYVSIDFFYIESLSPRLCH